jgi:hypothetical protein
MPEDGQIIGRRNMEFSPGRDPLPPMLADNNIIDPAAAAALVLVPLIALAAVVALPAKLTLPAGGLLALALFIPVLCILSVVKKHNKSKRREQGARQTDELRFTQYFQIYDRHPLPNIIRETWFPILAIFLFNLYFAQLLVYTPLLTAGTFGNFLLLGHQFSSSSAQTDDYLRQSLDVMCFAYLGWYVWTVSVIFSRIITMELVAATYYNALVRLVVAVFVALVFNHIQKIAFGEDTTFVAEAVGFGVGLFPDSALVSMSNRLRQYLLGAQEKLEEFPLDLIQGVSPFRKLRLFEMGMDNCENLASANAVELYLTSNLKLVEVADWIGQAQLAVLVGTKAFLVLQRNGYRTVIDFHRASHSPAGPVVAGLLNFKPEQLVDLAAGLEQDPGYRRLAELRFHLCQQAQPGTGSAEPSPPQG